MIKRSLSTTLLCLMLFSVFALVSSSQLAKACPPCPPPQNPPGYIGLGENVFVYFDGAAEVITLTFDHVTQAGWATAIQTTRYPPFQPPEQSEDIIDALSDEEIAVLSTQTDVVEPAWDITVTATFEDNVMVSIYYGDANPTTRIWQTDIIPADVNADGKVNRLDIRIILRALLSTPGSRRWNPYCDLNGDNKINLKDIRIAMRYLGQTSVWTPLEGSVEGQIVYGVTDHFSVFRCW